MDHQRLVRGEPVEEAEVIAALGAPEQWAQIVRSKRTRRIPSVVNSNVPGPIQSSSTNDIDWRRALDECKGWNLTRTEVSALLKQLGS
jgi:hypothetical protein